MSWARATVASACSFCDGVIAPGAPVRRGVQVLGYRWCVACAVARLGEEPPAVLDDEVRLFVPSVTPQARLTFDPGLDLAIKREQRARRARQAGRWQRDGRLTQLGERDR